jgi:glycine cleavage system H protein
MNVPEDLKYAESHEWLRPADNEGTVGITDHAQAELTDIVFVELPEIGRVVAPQEAVAVVESVKAASDIYSPVSGTIVAVNENLQADPALVNTDPFGEGWLFRIALSAPDELEALKDAAAYREQISG